MNVAQAMEDAAIAARPYSHKLGSAAIQDIGQDAVMAAWEASEDGHDVDITQLVHALCEREYKHARKDQGIVTVPLDDVADWLPSLNVSAGSEPGMDFGVSRMVVPGVANVTPMEIVEEAALASFARFAVIDWLEDASKASRRGRPAAVPPPLVDAITASLDSVLAFWTGRGRTRCAADWQAARAMSPTTEPVLSPAQLSDAEVSHYALEGKPRLRPTPIKVHTRDDESDGFAMTSFGSGKVNPPSRRGKREGQPTIALGGALRWADVGNRH